MKRKALFLDRDGVINRDEAYIGQIERFVFMDGVFDFLRCSMDRGYRLVVVTNQSGVARGFYSVADYERLTDWMRMRLAAEGIVLDAVLACFEHPDGVVPSLARESFWRKPRPGMFLQAAQALDLNLKTSVMIGDQARDLQAAEAAGVGRLLLLGDAPCDVARFERVAQFEEALAYLA